MNDVDPPDVQELARCLSKNTRLFRELLTGLKRKAVLADSLGVAKSTVYYRFEQLSLPIYDFVAR